ncbi:unnamed protein product [Calicophoron daubneyi]|uniref:Uncharacterized protein n=1 Tax=Calicophoron daubneyi TaxID=300641 RepID=A0AAV2TRK6_CALDB
MSQLAGKWHCKSHDNVSAFLTKIGEQEDFIKEAESDMPTLTISFLDNDHVVFEFEGKLGKFEETCKFGTVCEHKGPHGRTFKTILTKKSDTCMKSVLQDPAHPAHTVYHLVDHDLHVESTAGDVRAVTVFARDQ